MVAAVLAELKSLIEREEDELFRIRAHAQSIEDILLADAIEEEIKTLKRLYFELLDKF